MNVVYAHEIFQIPVGITVTDEYLKKRYRFIVKKTHPDIFNSQKDKLRAHQNFLLVQKAYEFMQNLKVTERGVSNLESEESDTNKTQNHSVVENIHETHYELEKSPYDWIFYAFLFPGGMLFQLLLTIPSVPYIFFFKDVGNSSGSELKYWFKLILFIIFTALPMLFGYSVLIYYFYVGLSKMNWLCWLVLIQGLGTYLLLGFYYIKRRFFMAKIDFGLTVT